MTNQQRRELAAEWRERAERLDAYARTSRREGYPDDAADAERAATDYRIAAEELDLGAELGRSVA